MARRRARWYVAPAAAMFVASACSGGSGASPPTSADAPDTTTLVDHRANGEFVLGALLPHTGPGASFGVPLEAGVEMAVNEINHAGGVNGRPIRLLKGDEGGDTATASLAMDELVEQGVDAIVGPASSRRAADVLDKAVESGVAVCSPTATAISLSDFPDRGLFIRTIPSDALQADAMAETIERTGRQSVAVFAADDDYGQRYAAALERSLQAREVTTSAVVAFDPTGDDLLSLADQALGTKPEVLAVIGDSAGGERMLAALRDAVDAAKLETIPPVVVNDALRHPDAVAALGTGAGSFIAKIQGVSPRSTPASSDFVARFAKAAPESPIDYAAYAYDCVNVLAIAAQDAGSDAPAAFMPLVTDVTQGGTTCRDFAECATALNQGRNIKINIDYTGASGTVEIDARGDVTSGEFDQFYFDEMGRDRTRTEISVRR